MVRPQIAVVPISEPVCQLLREQMGTIHLQFCCTASVELPETRMHEELQREVIRDDDLYCGTMLFYLKNMADDSLYSYWKAQCRQIHDLSYTDWAKRQLRQMSRYQATEDFTETFTNITEVDSSIIFDMMVLSHSFESQLLAVDHRVCCELQEQSSDPHDHLTPLTTRPRSTSELRRKCGSEQARQPHEFRSGAGDLYYC